MSYIEGGDTPKRDTSGDDSLLDKFNRWDKSLDAHWADWREEARGCFAMVAGHQVGKDEREKAEDSGVAYVVINKIDATISAICGSEILGRQEVRYYPREMSERAPPPIDPKTGQPQVDPKTGQPVQGQLLDAKVSEILTGAAEWVRDESDAAEEESQAFRDCIICGIGWTETRMDYDEDPEGMPKIERLDPLEMGIDPAARRPNAIDARYLRRKRRFPKDEAAERFGIDVAALPSDGPSSAQQTPHENYPHSAYDLGKTNDEAPLNKDEVEITEYQWFDLVSAHAVLNPQTGDLEVIAADQFEMLASAAAAAGAELKSQRIKQRKYSRAFRIDTQLLEVSDLPDGEFTYKAVTGKLDRNKGVWYGVVRAMIDPQRLTNKMVSQIQRIIDHNAKGGLLAEIDAFEDQRQAEDDWARSDSIVWVKSGSLGAHPRVMPKPASPYPAAIDRLLVVMDEAIPGVSGVNKEMLGLQQGTDQAGILDTQRKQAAYAVLAGFFDALRRYRRTQGGLLLKLITKYMSDGRLIRIVGRQGNVQYLPLARQPDTAKYDVIVDEAPAGPNQKERTFAFLQSPFGAQMIQKVPPQIQLKLLEYTPLPTSLVAEIQEIAANLPPTPDPVQQKIQGELALRQAQQQADIQQAQAQADLRQKEAAANLLIQENAGRQAIAQKQQEAALNLQLMQDKADREQQIALSKIEGEKQIALIRIANEHEIALLELQNEMEINEKKIAMQERVGKHKASMANGSASSDFSVNRPGGDLSE